MTAAQSLPFQQVNAAPARALAQAALVAFAAAAMLFAIDGPKGLMPLLLSLTVAFALGWVFSALTIEVDTEAVRWAFRHGWFARKLAIAELREADAADMGWTRGFGFRWTQAGPLYRAWGITCVRLHRESGKPIHLGTPDAAALIAAIEAAQARWLEKA